MRISDCELRIKSPAPCVGLSRFTNPNSAIYNRHSNMLLPLRTDSPLRTTPYMNWAIIAANAAMYVIQRLRPEVTDALQLYAHSPALYQFVTYAFLHGGLLHIVGNMLFLYLFGNNVNDKMGHIGYLLFYLAGAVFAAIGYAATSTSGGLLGASGAVWAVTGAYLVLFPRAHVSVVYFFVLIGHLELPSWVFVLFQLFWDVIALGNPNSEVAHVAHVAGALFGFGMSLSLLAGGLLPRDQFDVWALLKQWNRRRQYREMVAKGYDPFSYGAVAAQQGGYGATFGGSGGYGPRGPAGASPERQLPPVQDPRVVDLRAEIAEAMAHHNLPGAAELYLRLRAIDPTQVLSRQAQLDVANQLNAQQKYAEAADAYEAFLRTYPKFEQIEQIELMLGLIYARYLQQYDRAKGYLVKAMSRLHGERELAMARAELIRIEPFTIQTGPAL
jgi:membrane associated rhomboid family serine protease